MLMAYSVKMGFFARFATMYSGSNSLVAFGSSIAIVALCYNSRIHIMSNTIGKVISFFAKSSLIIYIVHCNKFVIYYVFSWMKNIWADSKLGISSFVLISTIIIMLGIAVGYRSVEWIFGRARQRIQTRIKERKSR